VSHHINAKGVVLICAYQGSSKTSLLQLIAKIITPKIFENMCYIRLVDLLGSGKIFENLWIEWHQGVSLDDIRSPPKDKQARASYLDMTRAFALEYP